MKIGLDIDNVLYPFTELYTRYAEQIHGLKPGTLDDVAYSWAWYKDQWGWTTEKFLDTYVEAVSQGMWLDGYPRPGALYMVRQLVKRGHEVVYVTAREVRAPSASVLPTVAWYQTKQWLRMNDFPDWENVHVTGDKHTIKTDVFLDDSMDVIQSLVDHGHPAPVLLTREHNVDVRMLRARRAQGFQHFLEIVDGIQLSKRGAWDVVA